MTDTPLRVVIADDYARIRGQVRAALEADGCEVVGEAATGEDAVRMTLESKPDVALLDIHMPGSGINAAAEITRGAPDVAVVMLTQSTEDDDLFDALRAGATGYLLKDTDPARLATVLRAVLAGEAAMPRRLVGKIMDEFRAPTKSRFSHKSKAGSKLSAREWEVMELLSQGLSTDEVARKLFLSSTTVRVHVSTVLRKLRVSDREAAFEALRER